MITPEMFAALSQQGFALSQQGFAEIELRARRARTKKALLDRLTEDELETLAIERSWDWCGTNWEQKDKAHIERILADRTPRTPAKKPLLKKISPFL